MLTVRGILHPTDFSDLSNNAFRLACSLALDYQAPLHVLHVATASEADEGELILKAGAANYLELDLERLAAYQWPGIKIRRRLEEGDPAEEIIRVSNSIPCDLIVMGSHGSSGFQRLLLGGVAEYVLRKATCQVIIVKASVSVSETSPVDAHGRTAVMK